MQLQNQKRAVEGRDLLAFAPLVPSLWEPWAVGCGGSPGWGSLREGLQPADRGWWPSLSVLRRLHDSRCTEAKAVACRQRGLSAQVWRGEPVLGCCRGGRPRDLRCCDSVPTPS